MDSVDPNWIWASGGLCAGCVLGVTVPKIVGLFSKKAIEDSDKKPNGDIDMTNRIGKFGDQVTTISDITMLMGSPTSSAGFLDTTEYHIYTAEKGYPVLTNNR